MPENSKSIHQTLEQARAGAAWRCVEEAKPKEGLDKYEALVKRFPALVHHNGLGQSASFLFSKSKSGNAEELLLTHLGKWLLKSDLNNDCACYAPPYDDEYPKEKTGTGDPLLTAIRSHDSRLYMRATLEAMAFLDYLRRFAEGINVKKAEKDAAPPKDGGLNESDPPKEP